MKLKIFNNFVINRYNTLLSNIKNNSNSFYDSYLDLLEETIKYILNQHNIKYNASSTCGNIIREKEVSNFLINDLNLDDYTFNKLPDYIKKCNDHKHKKEKMLSIESIVNYLRVYFNLINYYYIFINEEKIQYDEQYIISIYKETEIVNQKLKLEITNLKQDIYTLYSEKKISDEQYKQCNELLSLEKIQNFDLEEQNNFLNTQLKILSSIKSGVRIEEKIDKLEKQIDEKFEKQNQKLVNLFTLNEKVTNPQNTIANFIKYADKEYIWLSDKKLSLFKKRVLITGLINIVICIIITILTTVQIGYYTTYSFFENIYCLFMLAIIFKNLKYKNEMDHMLLEGISTFKFELNEIGLYCTENKERKSYKIFRIFAYISSIMNILLYLLDFNGFSIFIIIFEIIYFISLILNSNYKKRIHEDLTYAIKFTSKQIIGDKIVSIFYSFLEQKYYQSDEFNKIYGSLMKND